MKELQGFYLEKEKYRKALVEQGTIEPYEEIGFEFMEDIKVLDEKGGFCKTKNFPFPINYEKYLHGWCFAFAMRLHNEFGYKVENIYGDDGELVHAYCLTPAGEYVDIRGKTTNEKAFFSEFDDWLDVDELCQYKRDNVLHKIATDEEKAMYDITRHIINCHRSYYA